MSKEICHFDSLPNEIVELIFSNVPLINLFQTCSLVCSRWRDVIQGPEFIPWKKSYYRYKLMPEEDPEEDFQLPKMKKLVEDDPDEDVNICRSKSGGLGEGLWVWGSGLRNVKGYIGGNPPHNILGQNEKYEIQGMRTRSMEFFQSY